VSSAPAGLFFIVMNYGVHAIMYGYYFLMAIKMKPKWMNAKFITVAQISQMVVGVTVTLLCFRYYRISASSGRHCWVGSDNNAAACAMYGSYLFLFLKFFMTRYAVKKDRKVD
jgi:elongation of very long chain fatty acids protein 6